MDENMDIIEDIEEDVLPKEVSSADLKTLNKNIHAKDSMILYIPW